MTKAFPGLRPIIVKHDSLWTEKKWIAKQRGSRPEATFVSSVLGGGTQYLWWTRLDLSSGGTTSSQGLKNGGLNYCIVNVSCWFNSSSERKKNSNKLTAIDSIILLFIHRDPLAVPEVKK